ncbi:MAG TPA: tetratricopeptide repeat protein, partial [Ktedonobacteraceae bacterium]|nr:tetratricopeptide repeat protein [Ktedonobacteraceae bacterium]
EARRYLQEALEMLEQVMQQAATINYQEATARKTDTVSAAVSEANAQIHKEFQTRTERSLIGDLLEIGYAHERLGIVAASLGQVNDGLKHMHTALTIYEQNGLVTEMARVCSNLGAAYISKGEHDTARTYMYRSLDLAERAGDQPNMSFVMLNLANVLQRSGDLLEAEGWFTQSLSLAERMNNRERVSWCSVELAAVQEDLGKLHEAAASIQRAISVGRAIKSTRCIRYALVGLAELRILQVLTTCQLPLFESKGSHQLPAQGQRLLLRAKSTLQRATALEGWEAENIIDGKYLLAQVHFLLGDLKTAQCMALQTLKVAQEHETARIIECTYRLLGYILAAQEDYRQAEQYFSQAIQVCSERGLRLDYARALHGYGMVLLQRCRVAIDNFQRMDQRMRQEIYQQGMDYLHEAYEIFSTCHAAIDRVQVERTLAEFDMQGAVKG